MSPKTVEPLVLRDIYLANKIDEVYDDRFNYYKAGNHIIIDKETNTISVNPYLIDYKFGDGLIFDYNVLYLDSNLPDYYLGVENKLKLTPDNKIYYSFTPVENQVVSSIDRTGRVDSNFDGGSVTYFPIKPTIIGVTKGFSSFYDNITSGSWTVGYYDYWDEYSQSRFNGYKDDPLNPEHDPKKYNPGPLSGETPEGQIDFDPVNRNPVEYEDGKFKKAGPNYISGEIDMCPQNNVLYMW